MQSVVGGRADPAENSALAITKIGALVDVAVILVGRGKATAVIEVPRATRPERSARSRPRPLGRGLDGLSLRLVRRPLTRCHRERDHLSIAP